MKLSILVPAYNERYLIRECITRVLAAPLPDGVDREVVVVDDGSTDGTGAALDELARRHGPVLRLLRHPANRGKGAAVRSAVAAASGDILLVQDADLEYDPADYPALLAPILSGDADAVFGSRFSGERRRVLMFWHSLGNRALTFLSNMFTGLDLTDMWCCYKAVLASYLKGLPLRRDGFDVEPELVSKLAKRRCRIFETPISYRGRGYEEGKKIRWPDAVRSLWTMIWFWLVDDLYGEDRIGQQILHALDKATRFNDWMADVVRPHLGDRVLELGAGIGNLSAKLCQRDLYVATDSDPELCMHLERRFANRPGVRVLRVDIRRPEDIAPMRGAVDTAFCLNVLEHLDDDAAALANIVQAVAPGGRVLVLVPHLPWAFGSLDEVLGHRRRYTRARLQELLASCGLAPEAVFEFNRASLPGWIWNGKVLRRRHFSRLQLKAFDSLVWLLRRVDRRLPWPGQSLIAVGRKPATAGGA